jgi:hypothetical protein
MLFWLKIWQLKCQFFNGISDLHIICMNTNEFGKKLKKEDTMANIIKRNTGNMPMTLSGLVDRVFNDNLTSFFDDNLWGFNGLRSCSQVPSTSERPGKPMKWKLWPQV